MDIDNIIGKVTGNADKLGLLLGVTTGSSAGFADLTSTIENIMAGNIHPPNLQAALSSYAAEGFGKAGVMVAVLGYIIKEINLNPTLNKIGDVAQKGGIGYALGSLISKLLWESTHSAAWRNEQDVTALDTSTPLIDIGADTPGAFVVPSHAAKITEIRIGAWPDYTADTLEGFTSAVRLSGSGLKAPESWIPGPSGMVGGVATTSAGLGITPPMTYFCNIPVNKGMLINAYGFMHGSADMGSLRVTCSVVYDGPVVGRWSWMDYREGDTATANAGVALTGRGGAVENDFRPGGPITEIVVGVGGVPVAGPLAAPTIIQLSGNGLVVGGNYIFQGPGVFTQDDITASGDAKTAVLVKYECEIATKVNGLIRATAQEINDDVGTPSHIIGLGYR